MIRWLACGHLVALSSRSPDRAGRLAARPRVSVAESLTALLERTM